MKKSSFNRIRIIENEYLEGYDLIDILSPQDHDGDDAKEIIATVYSHETAKLIANLLRNIEIDWCRNGRPQPPIKDKE